MNFNVLLLFLAFVDTVDTYIPPPPPYVTANFVKMVLSVVPAFFAVLIFYSLVFNTCWY